MIKMTVTQPYACTSEECKNRLATLGATLSESYGLAVNWQSDTTAKVERTGVKGTLCIEAGQVSVVLELSFVLSPMRDTIATKIREELKRLIATKIREELKRLMEEQPPQEGTMDVNSTMYGAVRLRAGLMALTSWPAAIEYRGRTLYQGILCGEETAAVLDEEGGVDFVMPGPITPLQAKHICQRIDSARQAGGAAGRSSAWRDLRNLIGAQAEGGDGANT